MTEGTETEGTEITETEGTEITGQAQHGDAETRSRLVASCTVVASAPFDRALDAVTAVGKGITSNVRRRVNYLA